MTGASKNTIAKLLVDVGTACSECLDKTLVNLNSKRTQCDELWGLVGAKQRTLSEMIDKKVCQDIWTWVDIDADSKLICFWLVGKRDGGFATEFTKDLASRVQLTTDSLKLTYYRLFERSHRCARG